jgi:ankyrin repeat protein/N-acetylneuraminic acid mutarotase
MKTIFLAGGLLLGAATFSFATTNDATTALQRGLFEEEANQNLAAAIQAYRAVANQFDKDRKLAATAIFRLGECYRKQGAKNDAVAQYERVLRDFSDQASLVTLSRQALVDLSASPGAPSATATTAAWVAARQDQRRLLQEEIKLMETKLADQQKQVQTGLLAPGELTDPQREILRLKRQLAALDEGQPGAPFASPTAEAASSALAESLTLDAQIDELQKLPREKLRVAIQQGFPNPVLTSLMQRLTEAEQNLASAQKEYGPQHGEVQKLVAMTNTINKQIDAQIEAALRSLEIKRDAAKKTAEALRIQTAAAPAPTTTAASASEPTAPTSSEAEEVKRIQAMIKDSPDLINAKDLTGASATPLHRAAEKGELIVAQFLLANGADVAAKNNSGDTPLHNAARAGHKAMVELLLKNKANVQALNNSHLTPLHLAAGNGFRSVAEVLLDAGADVNARTGSGPTPLLMAAANGFRSVAELLLTHGADVNAATSDVRDSTTRRFNGTPLCVAAARGDLPLVDLLLANKADLTAPDDSGAAPLHLAALGGNTAMAGALLAGGASVDSRASGKDTRGWTPLHFAVNANQKEMVAFLLQNKADPNARIDTKYGEGGLGYTPLLIATARVFPDIVDLLLEANADPNLGNATRVPILNATNNEDPAARKRMLKSLLDHGAQPNAQETDGSTPLLTAAARGDEAATALLLAAKPDINAQNKNGYSALHLAVFAGQNRDVKGLINALIAAGANPNLRSRDGDTPLHLAVSQRHPELVELLLAQKADPNIRNNRGETPLDLAKRYPSTLPAPPLSYQWAAPGPPGLPIANGNFQVGTAGLPGSTPVTSPPSPPSMADLLRQHGALDDLPNTDRISLRRPAANYSSSRFNRTAKDWSRFTLFDLLAIQYELLTASPSGEARVVSEPYEQFARGNGLDFPDLAHIRIRRLGADLQTWQVRTVDLSTALKSGDCAADIPLAWGDVVEIPEADHVLNERWPGLSKEVLATLRKCLTRHIQLNVKGRVTDLTLSPDITVAEGIPTRVLMNDTFMILPALNGSGLLLASSDLAHIKVTRRDPATGQTSEWIVDCSDPHNPPDLWLRDSDRIDVPEKSTASASSPPSPNPPAPAPRLNAPGTIPALPTRTLRLPPARLPQVESDTPGSPDAPKPQPDANSFFPRSSATGLVFSPSPNDSDLIRSRYRPDPASKTRQAESWQQRADADLEGRAANSTVWTGSEMIIFGGDGNGVTCDNGARYSFSKNSWNLLPRLNAPSARTALSAVWTGKEMIVWGGFGGRLGNDTNRNDGACFNPASNSWKPVSTRDAPDARFNHSALWTGKEMLIWGGYTDSRSFYQGARADAFLNSGGRYNPSSDSWKPITTRGAPSKRFNHAAVWSGKEMLVWGGCNAATALDDGARYDPARDVWKSINPKGAPGPRGMPVAVWTGKEMIVWGGASRDDGTQARCFEDGARYNPDTDSWTPMSRDGAPKGRVFAKAVWTGTEMLVWGGVNDAEAKGVSDSNRYIGTGARYNPATDTWTPMTNLGAPSPRLAGGVWTGNGLLLFGGFNGLHLNDTWFYSPLQTLYPYTSAQDRSR